MQFLTIRQATTFLEENPAAYEYIQLLVNEYIRARSPFLSKSTFHREFGYLKSFSFVQDESEKVFLLNFDSLPVCYVLMKIAEKMTHENMPVEPVACIRFIGRFAEMIRQPDPQTAWYANLRVQFETYALVYLHQVYEVDVTAFVEGLTGETRDLMGTDIHYRYIFPYLHDDTKKQFAAISRMLSDERTEYAGLDALSNIGRIHPERAAALYEFAKASETRFLTPLLIELYPRNGGYYLDEAIELFKKDPLEGLLTLTGFDYHDEKHTRLAVDLIQRQKGTNADYLRMLPAFYVRLIENKNTPEETVQQCFKEIEALAAYEDLLLRDDLAWRIGRIKGRDKEKNDLFPKSGPGLLDEY